jgi:hypothetical protein
MTITYEVYLDCLKAGLVPNPKKNPYTTDICYGVNCNDCPLTNISTCLDDYLDASKTHYPILLTQNPELAL